LEIPFFLLCSCSQGFLKVEIWLFFSRKKKTPPAICQPKNSVGPNTRTRVVWKFFKNPNTSPVWGKEKKNPWYQSGPAGMFKHWYKTKTGCKLPINKIGSINLG
jgi:hypothetical protein